MEHDDTKLNKTEIKNIVFLILLALCIGSLIFAAVILVKNADEIKTNPVQYAIDRDFYESCICYTEHGLYNFGMNTTNNEVNKYWTDRNN